MGKTGIEIDTITFFDDEFLVSVEKLHRPLKNKEDFFAFVLGNGFLLRVERKGQDKGFHVLIREGMGNGLISILEGGAFPGDQRPFPFSYNGDGGLLFLFPHEI